MRTHRSLLKADESSRREFLSHAVRAFLGVSILPYSLGAARAEANGPATAKRVIYLFMTGGMSQLDTFSPKPEAKEVQGATTVIPTSADGIRIASTLPRMAKQMHRVAVIASMNSNQGAHEQGVYYLHTNYTMRGTIQHPGLGSWVSLLAEKANPTLPSSVVINGGSRIFGAGYLESKFAPLPIGDPSAGLRNSRLARGVTEPVFQRRLELAQKMNASFLSRTDNKKTRSYRDVYDEALALMKSEDLKAFDITEESDATRESYGNSAFGQGCLLARRLAEHDVRFIEVALGNWDTHQDNFNRVPDLAADLDQGMGALLGDLSSRGLLDDTLVVLATEFGRTPDINGGDGRDHYPKAFTCLMAGGGVKGGQIYGQTDAEGREVAENKVGVPDFNATIGKALGLPVTREIFSPNGRPFTMANKGTPIAIF